MKDRMNDRIERVPNPNGPAGHDGTLMSSLAAHGMYTSRHQTVGQNNPQRQSLIRPQSRSAHHFQSQTHSLRPRQNDAKKDVYTWTVGGYIFNKFGMRSETDPSTVESV